jgi:hypothetical protein
MRRITIKRARTWHYRKMRHCIEQSNDLARLSPFRSWLGCIINTSGYDFRKGQVVEINQKIVDLLKPLDTFVRVDSKLERLLEGYDKRRVAAGKRRQKTR